MDDIISYDISYVLPLTLNRSAFILNQMNEVEELIHQVVLTPIEARVLKVLLDHAPRMAPYDDVVQVWYGSPQVTVQGRSKQERNTLLAPVRTLLTALNGKLAPFNLVILAVYETGYLLRSIKGDIEIDLS